MAGTGEIEEGSSPQLHPLLRGRWSPLSFDPAYSLSKEDVDLLLEAARWAPSAGNSQPWGFVTARREEAQHAALAPHLAASARRWAVSASLLIVNLAHRRVDESGLQYSEFADYDLGQAVAHMTIQAQAMGLSARQFRAFDLESLTAALGLAPGWDVVSMTAIGRPGRSQAGPRTRRVPASLVHDPFRA